MQKTSGGEHAELSFILIGGIAAVGFALALSYVLDYLIGEKLIRFAEAAEQHPEFAKELPRFLAAIWRTFNEYELAGYVASTKPSVRMQLRRLLYLR